MEVRTWSADQLRLEFVELVSLAQVIEAVESRFWKQGKVVCEIKVNGMSLDEKDEVRFASENIDGIRELQISVQNPNDLLVTTLTTAQAYLPKIKESAILAADYFQRGRQEDGHQLCLKILDSCKWLSDLLFLIKKSCHNWAKVNLPESSWKRAEIQFSEAVRLLYSSYEEKDNVSLADSLEYDLSNSIDTWRELLSLLTLEMDEKPVDNANEDLDLKALALSKKR
ncbi:MAG: hypothetical protein KDD35_06030 [Bdellovibrionales bacterium]|nr:hypothetical protein [Bdellovibrionales bacterium]